MLTFYGSRSNHKSNHNRPPLDLFQRITTFSFFSSAKSDKNGLDMEHLDFKIVVEPKDSQSFTIILVASSRQEKSAWTSDISQARLLTTDNTEWSTQPWARPLPFTHVLWFKCCPHAFLPPYLSIFHSLLQCIDNIRCNGLMMNAFEENSKVSVPQMIK